jgi:hypothetical protein
MRERLECRGSVWSVAGAFGVSRERTALPQNPTLPNDRTHNARQYSEDFKLRGFFIRGRAMRARTLSLLQIVSDYVCANRLKTCAFSKNRRKIKFLFFVEAIMYGRAMRVPVSALRALKPFPHCSRCYVGARIARLVVRRGARIKSSVMKLKNNNAHRIKLPNFNAVRISLFCGSVRKTANTFEMSRERTALPKYIRAPAEPRPALKRKRGGLLSLTFTRLFQKPQNLSFSLIPAYVYLHLVY